MSFSYFSHLPTEIQCQIWHECLPKRLIEVNFPDTHRNDFWDILLHQRWDSEYCIPQACAQTLRANHARPVISHVCRQSREIAYMYGQIFEKGLSGGISSERYWVQPKFDVLYLNQNQRCLPYTDTDGHHASPLRAFLECASMMNMPMSLSHRVLFDFSRREAAASFTHSEAIEDLQAIAEMGCRPLEIVVQTVVLHLDQGVAHRSGLFGPFGHETLRPVAISDTAQLRRYRLLWETHIAPLDPRMKPVFDLFESPKQLARAMQLWYSRVYYRLIGAVWIHRTADRGEIHQPMKDIWYPPLEKGCLPSSDLNKLDYEHPWVQEVFKQLPIIQPKVVFRHCFSWQCKQD